MRSLPLLALVALAGACAAQHERAEEEDRPLAAPPPPPEPKPIAPQVFSEPVGDAVGDGLDLSDTSVLVDDDGMLVIDVDIPDAKRREPSPEDSVQVYLDVDRDHENSGYDVRLVLVDGAFSFERWERGKWRDRTPATYEASFDQGLHIRVPAADVGVPRSFDFFVASIDERTGKISDLAPDGALWERWSYSR